MNTVYIIGKSKFALHREDDGQYLVLQLIRSRWMLIVKTPSKTDAQLAVLGAASKIIEKAKIEEFGKCR